MIELTLTERGAEAARALPSLIANALNAQLDGFSADDVTLTGLLQRFIANEPVRPVARNPTKKRTAEVRGGPMSRLSTRLFICLGRR